MLRTYSAFFAFLRSLVDIVIIISIWLIVYYIRFHTAWIGIPESMLPFKTHLQYLIPVVAICYFTFLWLGLYKSKRTQNVFMLVYNLLKATLLCGLLILSFFYYVKEGPYSRKLLTLFIVMLPIGLSVSHILVMAILRVLRKENYNLRLCVIIGAGKKGQQLAQDIKQIKWLGLKCVFFVDDAPSVIGSNILGIPVYGPIENIYEKIISNGIDEVYLALGGNSAQKVYPILENLQSSGITIRIVPDWGNLISLTNTSTINIGSQILFSAEDSPLRGGNIIIKSIFDIFVSLVLLLILSVPIIIISVIIKASSQGPVFYKQTRLGIDQKEFGILKFRTMKIDAENKTGPKWSVPNDDRCTYIGKILRKTSLDEIPQLLNVLKGEMSLVGPRPERPFFVKQFSEEYRKYMIRHKVKAGITGWAQIHGYRGNTSLRKRLIYDLYYVKSWSFWLDLWILLLTPWHVVEGKMHTRTSKSECLRHRVKSPGK